MKKKLMFNKKIIICIIVFLSTLFIMGCLSFVHAGYISENVDELDDAKYPRV